MTRLLEFNDLQYSVGEKSNIRISGELREGGILNIAGPSGVGKTTLLRVLARLKQARGNVFLSGKNWSEFTPTAWRRSVHYLSQKPAIFDGTVKDNLAKPFELDVIKNGLALNWSLAAEIMEKLSLSAKLLDQDARTLSGGEASRMALVRALLVEPSVLLLDEPLAALDRKSSARVVELVSLWKRQVAGRGVILVSHVGEFDGLEDLSTLTLEKGVDETVE